MKETEIRSNTFYFILLFALSLVFRLLLIIIFKFDGLYGQDSYAYLEFSKRFYESIIQFQIPPNFYWPISYYLFTSVFTIFTIGNLDLAGLLVSLVSGSLCPGFVYLLAFELASEFEHGNRKVVSLYAGLITAFSPVLVKQSIVIMSDSLGLMFAAWGMWQLVKYFNDGKLKNIVFTFIMFSLAVMTRYAFSLLAVPVLAYIIYNISVQKPLRLKYLKDTAIASLIGLIVFAPQLYYIFSHGISYFQYEGEHPTWAAGWNILNFFKKEFMTFDGTKNYRLWNGLYYLTPSFHPMYLQVFGFAFLTGLYFLVKRKQKRIAILMISWIAAYYLYLSGNPFQSLRYTMSFLPAMAVISAYGLAAVNLKNLYKNIFLYAGLALFILYGVIHINTFTRQKNSELEVVNLVKSGIPANSTIFAFDITLAVRRYTDFKAEELFNKTEEQIRNKIDSSQGDVYFILPVESIKTQWKGLPLEKKYNFLRGNYPLQTVTRVNRFTIFKIPVNK